MSETQGYAALVAARAPALLRLAVMLTGDRAEAEDLLQSTLLHTQRHADRIAAMAAPDRAVALTSAPPRPHRGRVLLAAAAAVALVAVGTTYVVSRGSGAGPSAGPSSPPTSAPPTGQSNAANRAAAVSLADTTASRLPVYPGAEEVSATDVPPLVRRTMSSSPSNYTVTRSRFWTVRGVPRTVAEWYARHPQQGFVSDGGPNGVGGESRPDGGWIDDVYLDQHPPTPYAPAGASVVVQTTSLAGGRVGVRATVDAVWRPARPAASFVSHVRGVTVQITATRYGAHTPRVRHRTVTIGSPDQVGALVTAYNKLPGWPPFFHSCPMQLTQRRYRIVFHTAAGDVSASGPMSCYDTLTVRRDGRRVGPYLDLASDLLGLLPH